MVEIPIVFTKQIDRVPKVAIGILVGVLLPASPDEITISSNLLMNFRIVSTVAIGLFWGILGILLGSFWDMVKPHETAKFVTT